MTCHISVTETDRKFWIMEIELKYQHIAIRHVISEPYLTSLEEWRMLCNRQRVDTGSMSYKDGVYTIGAEEEGQGNDQYSEIFISDPEFITCLKDVIDYAETQNLRFCERTEDSDYYPLSEEEAEDYRSVYSDLSVDSTETYTNHITNSNSEPVINRTWG